MRYHCSSNPMAHPCRLEPMSRHDQRYANTRVLEGRRKWGQALADNARPPESFWQKLVRFVREYVW